jgi:hypothetical protein
MLAAVDKRIYRPVHTYFCITLALRIGSFGGLVEHGNGGYTSSISFKGFLMPAILQAC